MYPGFWLENMKKGPFGGLRLIKEDNNKMHLKKTQKVGADWIQPVDGNTVMNKHYFLACVKI
jgi:hypothetical protein